MKIQEIEQLLSSHSSKSKNRFENFKKLGAGLKSNRVRASKIKNRRKLQKLWHVDVLHENPSSNKLYQIKDVQTLSYTAKDPFLLGFPQHKDKELAFSMTANLWDELWYPYDKSTSITLRISGTFSNYSLAEPAIISIDEYTPHTFGKYYKIISKYDYFDPNTTFSQSLDTPSYRLDSLINAFNNTHSPEAYRSLARDIRELVTIRDLNKLQTSLTNNQMDEKKAILLQMIAELKDPASLKYFKEEIRNKIHGKEEITPDLSLISAITFVRFFNFYDQALLKMIKSVVTKSQQINTKESKMLIIGALVTLGKLGKLEDLDELLIELFRSKDTDIVEESIDTVFSLLEKSKKNRSSENKNILRRITASIIELIKTYQERVESENSITANKRILSKSIKLLASINIDELITLIPDLLKVIKESKSKYVLHSLLNSVISTPNDKDLILLDNIIKF